MKTLVRADFNFKDEATGILYCRGYVVCENVQLAESGSYTFRVNTVVVQKFIGTAPDFEKIEELAIKNCKLFDDEIIDVGRLAEHHD
jgi:hypothetical protein